MVSTVWLRRAAGTAALFAIGSVLTAADPAAAQGTPREARRDPLDAKADVPPLRYESPFALYRRMTETKVGSWPEANETVNRIGGWRAYIREAQGASAPGAGAPVGRPDPDPVRRAPGQVPSAPRGHGDHPSK